MPYYIGLLVSLTAFCISPVRRAIFNPVTTPFDHQKTRLQFFDLLRGIAIIAVVVIHITKILYEGYPQGAEWGYPVNAAARFAIGFFFIASGALLPSILQSPWTFWKPKITRVLIPYTAAVAIICLLLDSSIPDFFYKLVTGTAAVPYYFIPALMQMYIVYFILNPVRERSWFLPLCFLISLTFYVVKVQELHFLFVGFRYLFFFAYGMAHSTRLLGLRPSPAAFSFTALLLFYLVLVVAVPGVYGNEQFVYSIACLEGLLFLYASHRIPKWLAGSVARIGKLSLWIFLVHYPFSEWSVAQAVLKGFPPILYGTVLTLILSIISAWVLDTVYKKTLSLMGVQ